MSVRQIGLLFFALVVGLNACVLGMDAALYAEGLPTVTNFCRDHPWAAGIIIIVNIFADFALAIHFSAFEEPTK